MITTLYIKHYALIDELSVEFEPGLNVVTGETGAGKSIIIDALSLLLGERADPDAVRKGADRAIVEGAFAVGGNAALCTHLRAQEIEGGNTLIVRREVSAKGQSRCFVNDSPASITVLKEIGRLLVDLHGQHEHQSLLRPETHIKLIDEFGGLEGLLEEYRASYRRLQDLTASLEDLRSREQQLKERRDLFEFQIQEIDRIDPRPGEEDTLGDALNILENAEKLFAATERLHQLLYESENAIHDQLILVRNQLGDLAGIDGKFEEARNEAASAAAIVQELAKFLQQYNSRVEFTPERLEEIRNRLGQLALLKKKYGGSIEAILAHRRKIGTEFQLAENYEREIAAREEEITGERTVCSAAAQRLSAKRREVARKIDRLAVKALASLGISNAMFETVITTRTFAGGHGSFVEMGRDALAITPDGVDIVEFFLTTNVGEDLKPLVKVASGGEISRIMLALKTILAKSDRLPLLIFDEIDAGISGRIAQVVGQNLKLLSQYHQIVAITHLPQIAGLADSHFAVEKIEDGRRAFTQMRKLTLEERVVEIAKLMSGEEITQAGLDGARELMGITSTSQR